MTARQAQANLTSLVGATLCVSAGACLLAGGPMVLAAVLFPLGALCDVLDGVIARHAVDRPETPTGAIIDSVCDKVGEVGIGVGLVAPALGSEPALFLLAGASGVSWLTSYAKSVSVEHGLQLDWREARIFGRAGRAVILSAILLLTAMVPNELDRILVTGFGVLLTFNCVTFGWRLVRLGSSLPTAGGVR